MQRAVKERTCRVRECKKRFKPARPMQVVCSPRCAAALVEERRKRDEKRVEKDRRRETREKLEELKALPQLIAEADSAFAAYIRLRDRMAGHLCISSGALLDWSGNAVDAGHYRSRGAASHLRYDERNCHAQSKYDNRHRAGNVVEYRIGLIARIGERAVIELEHDNRTHKWTRDEVREIRDKYRAKRAELKRRGYL